METINKIEFTEELVKEYTFRKEEIGKKKCSMELFTESGTIPNTGKGCVEWIVNNGEYVEQIGIWWENKTLTDYDGVFELPEQAVKLIRSIGIKVPQHFID